ncbi:MAG: hypothetical protein M3321_02215 [Actinomycetota bacterium]|nr:hypothetical protein [Actinomycetota bacterium]
MSRLLLVALVAVALLPAVAADRAEAIYFEPYWTCYFCGPWWADPGETQTSEYDGCSYRWDGNSFQKSDTALGTIAFLDTSGGWVFSRQTYEVNMTYYITPYDWTKKLLSKNSSSVGYSANSLGHRRTSYCL